MTRLKDMVFGGTMAYKREHGKAPRGYGEWGFACGTPNAPVARQIWVSGTYGEAKQKALLEAKERGETRLYLLP